jgi:MFS family permease
MLLSSLGTSIANVGLPTMAQAFNASFQEVQWVVLAYLLAITTLIVSVGRLGDIIGRRRLLLAGIVFFPVASVYAAPHRAVAADCRPGGAGRGSGHHDGPRHGLCR